MKKGNEIAVYGSLKEIVKPDHSCLVVWDVQNGLVDRIFNKEEFMTNLKNLIEKLRGRMPIIYTLITPMHRDFTSSWSFFSMMRRFNVDDINKLPSFMAAGSKEREIPETVQPHNFKKYPTIARVANGDFNKIMGLIFLENTLTCFTYKSTVFRGCQN